MSQQAPLSAGPPPSNANGVLTAPTGRAAVGANKKKAKRRAKAAAKTTLDQHLPPPPAPHVNGQPASIPGTYPPGDDYYAHGDPHYSNSPYDPHHHHDDHLYYTSDEDDEPIAYDSRHHHLTNGSPYADPNPPTSSKNKKKKKKKGLAGAGVPDDVEFTPDVINTEVRKLHETLNPVMSRQSHPPKQDRIWNTSTQEERERIKEFWLSLSEDERKGLLKIEKNAVLSKMKEQQKHSCSCTVCGRKRTAIEEELEVLYDAYYEELAQYANQRPGEVAENMLEQRQPALSYPQSHAVHTPKPLNTSHAPQHRQSRVHEIIDDAEEEEFSDEEESYSDEDEIYSEEEAFEDAYVRAGGSGFFDFGNNLTVKGGSFITDMLTHLHGRLNNLPDGILTVADDLLKNDGKKFIEMMEQLAERRMQREQDIEWASRQPAHSHPPGEPPLDDDEEFDDEDDYDSQEEYDDDEEESDMGGLTDEQRMEEGRRMFQIFAARMFEQRVLTAYREKVAAERQAKLLEELEEESKAKTQKDAKKAKDAEKKKNKKQAQKQAKAEEKAKREAEKAAEEAAIKAAEEKRLDDQRRKKEEQRKKREAEKKAQDEERSRKEAERLKRLQEERDRKAEEERREREKKAQEKRARDEQRKKEREEREALEREAREQKAHDDRMRKEQESRKKTNPTPQQPPQIMKRPSQPGAIAVPSGLVTQKSSSGVSSPHIPVATPVIPKPATPGVKPRRSSGPEISTTSPRANIVAQAPSKTKSPPRAADQQPQPVPKQILQNPHKHQQQQRPAVSLPQPASQQGPPPGVHPPYLNSGFGNMGFPPFAGQHAQPIQQRPGPPQFPQQPPPGSQFRQFPSGAPPPGVNGFGGAPQGRGFVGDVPPGFQPQMPGLGSHAATPGMPSARTVGPSHSRQHSANDLDMSPPAHAQPISRPAPIQRPSSVKPSAGDHLPGGGPEVDDLSKHLGSRALLDDGDDPLPPPSELRRTSNPIGAPRATNLGFSSPHFGGPPNSFGNPQSNWSTPNTFGPPSGLNTPSWGGPIGAANWSSTNSAFAPLTSGGPRTAGNTAPRPRAVRLAVCAACRHLSGPAGSTASDFHDVTSVLSQIERAGSLEPPLPSLQEVEDICETEGDAHNGGGLLHIRRSGPNFAVKFEPDGATPNSARPGVGQLGEIGSPVPGAREPVFGRGFGGIGGLASPGGF